MLFSILRIRYSSLSVTLPLPTFHLQFRGLELAELPALEATELRALRESRDALCYVPLRYAMLRCAALCRAMLSHAMLEYTRQCDNIFLAPFQSGPSRPKTSPKKTQDKCKIT